MDSEQDQGAAAPPEPRLFTSSIPLSSGPSRRSQLLMWLCIGLAGCAVLLVVLLYYTSGFGLWFSR